MGLEVCVCVSGRQRERESMVWGVLERQSMVWGALEREIMGWGVLERESMVWGVLVGAGDGSVDSPGGEQRHCAVQLDERPCVSV